MGETAGAQGEREQQEPVHSHDERARAVVHSDHARATCINARCPRQCNPALRGTSAGAVLCFPFVGGMIRLVADGGRQSAKPFDDNGSPLRSSINPLNPLAGSSTPMKSLCDLFRLLVAGLLLKSALAVSPVFAAEPSETSPDAAAETKEKPADEKSETEKGKKAKSIAEFTKDMTLSEGLLPIYRSKQTGEAYLLLTAEHLEREYILFAYTENGVPRAGHFRGRFHDERIVRFQRDFDRILLIAENTGFHFDSASPLVRAKGANISPAVLAVNKITVEDSSPARVLIKADSLFLTETLYQLKPSADPQRRDPARFTLGKMSAAKTRYSAIRNYPANTDIVVDYVYEEPAPPVSESGLYDLTDPRYVSIKVQYSLLAVPENDYRPRLDDERVGYFTTRVDDLTAISATPWRDVIHRWHLVKKNPKAAVSEPVEPIVWWIENTTPIELRETIRDAALAWNKAFAAAGFKDALVVKQQPDDADWDAGDIRYNVLRWTASPNPPFGGYGPSFVNPRTGQILGADIMLEYVFVSRHVRYPLLADTAAADEPDSARACCLGSNLQLSSLAGLHALRAAGAPDVEKSALLKQSLYYLVLHELGHTLGLNHNMKASSWLTPEKLHDADYTSQHGLTASVMDYPAINLAPLGRRQGQFYTTTPGPYDFWAIEFGYSPHMDDAAQRTRLLARSTEPALRFGNDADDMRTPGRGLDPRVMIDDLSADPVSYAVDRIIRVRAAIEKIADSHAAAASYQELRDAYLVLSREHARAAGVISRQIGGVLVERTTPGQPGFTGQPLSPVSLAEQKRAMEALRKHVFAPTALTAPPRILAQARTQRRGFDFRREPEDLKLHAQVLRAQSTVLDHLLHPVVTARVSDTRLYGNDYSVAAMLADLTDAIFADDTPGDVTTTRQNLQAEYVNRLVTVAGSEGKPSKHDHLAQAGAVAELQRIGKLLRSVAAQPGARDTTVHREHQMLKIARALAVSPPGT